MVLRRLLSLLSLVAVAVIVLLPAAPAEARRRRAAPLPGWSVTGEYAEGVEPGFVSLDGQYSFDFEGLTGAINVIYDVNSRLVGNGIVDMTFFPVRLTSKVDEDGLQHVSIVDNPKSPTFSFDGIVTENGRDIVGTYLRSGGFAGLTGANQGPTTFRRTFPPIIASKFFLRLTTTMDRKGRIRGAKGLDRKEIKAELDAYAGRKFSGGLVRGKVTTTRAGVTTARLDIKGRNWSIAMTGPVDVDGFHATATIRAAPFVAKSVPILLEVKPGPQPPPPPPPPDPDAYRRVTGGSATNLGGAVQITKSNVAAKFFGAPASVTIDFPSSGIATPMEANQSSAGQAQPIRFFVKVGAKTYGTAAVLGRVTLTVRQFTGVPGGAIEVLCKGKVSDAAGHTKNVDIVIDAVLGQ